MRVSGLVVALGCALFVGSAASAATIGYTEGIRPTVAGTIDINPPDVASGSPGFDVGDLGVGAGEFETIEIYGRIVGAKDTYNFSSSTDFIIEFIFGGYDLEGGGSVTESGFVKDNSGGSSSNFSLTTLNGLVSFAVANPVMTDITSGASLLFAATAGDYIFMIDGLTDAATYDIRIQAVPIPAALPLFLAGMGSIGLLGRRRRKAIA